MKHGAFGTVNKTRLEGLANTSTELECLGKAIRHENWRAYCFQRSANKFSSLVTYLAQLLAHDVTKTSIFNTGQLNFPDADTSASTNLRENILFLDTIYGEGLELDEQLYRTSPAYRGEPLPLFRVDTHTFADKYKEGGERNSNLPSFVLHSAPERIRPHLLPVLADSRNSDQPILLKIAAEFMAFHNKIAMAHIEKINLHATNDKKERNILVADVFFKTRIKVVMTWHNIIKNDILGKVVSKKKKKKSNIRLSRNEMIHGVMRSFHCLPISQYKINSGPPFKISQMLKDRATRVSANLETAIRDIPGEISTWASVWDVDWDIFLSDRNNQTCFTPSMIFDDGEIPILLRDVDSSENLGVPSELRQRKLGKSTDRFLEDLSFVLGDEFPELRKIKAADVPVQLALLAEAYALSVKTGKMGPTSSFVFENAIENFMASTEEKIINLIGRRNFDAWRRRLPRDFNSMLNYGPKPGAEKPEKYTS